MNLASLCQSPVRPFLAFGFALPNPSAAFALILPSARDVNSLQLVLGFDHNARGAVDGQEAVTAGRGCYELCFDQRFGLRSKRTIWRWSLVESAFRDRRRAHGRSAMGLRQFQYCGFRVRFVWLRLDRWNWRHRWVQLRRRPLLRCIGRRNRWHIPWRSRSRRAKAVAKALHRSQTFIECEMTSRLARSRNRSFLT
jgi:hypothetical protein